MRPALRSALRKASQHVFEAAVHEVDPDPVHFLAMALLEEGFQLSYRAAGCGVVLDNAGGIGGMPCVRTRGHDGVHDDGRGNCWRPR
jgi:hypothetical protein